MKRLFSDGSECCGCSACRNICPRNAISMRENADGFAYPQVDAARCTDCGLCERVCPMRHRPQANRAALPEFYALKHRSEEVRMQSSSGGAFTALSDWILAQGGTVYGAAFDCGFQVCHRRAATCKERDAFRGSKYVQSRVGTVFIQVKQDLQSGLPVLFSGTPCQVGGLASYLAVSGINSDRLFLCDLVCHGTPSPKLWTDYLRYLEKRYRSKIRSYSFRDKKFGWRGYQTSVTFQNGLSVHNCKDILAYTKLFGMGLGLRPACYRCPYASLQRPSDLTIGDFWGIEKAMPDFEDKKGVSLVLVHTEKGKRLLLSLRDRLELRPLLPEQGMQWNLQKPSVPACSPDDFWRDYRAHGFPFLVWKYAEGGAYGRLKRMAKTVLKRLGLFNAVQKLLR